MVEPDQVLAWRWGGGLEVRSVRGGRIRAQESRMERVEWI